MSHKISMRQQETIYEGKQIMYSIPKLKSLKECSDLLQSIQSSLNMVNEYSFKSFIFKIEGVREFINKVEVKTD